MSIELFEINRQFIATNNGLEQVYQNRLVEGRDFERWDWLSNNGTSAYIALNTYNNALRDIIFKAQSDKAQIYGFNANNRINYNGGDLEIRVNQTNNGLSQTIGNDIAIRMYGSGSTWRVATPTQNIVLNYISWYWGTARNTYLFRTNILNTSGDIADIKCYKDAKISLTPCQLLTPCPPNLSANGKAYPIGECGMIDSVSGKFYGNSGSGSFSVYNDPVTE